jgi:hypothetical protein
MLRLAARRVRGYSHVTWSEQKVGHSSGEELGSTLVRRRMSRGGDEEATAEFEAGEEGWMMPLLAHRFPPALLAALARGMTAKTSNLKCACTALAHLPATASNSLEEKISQLHACEAPTQVRE